MVNAMSVRLALTVVVVWAVVGCGKDDSPQSAARGRRQAQPPARPTTPAVYRVVLKSTWTPAKHPFEYPKGAHFSGLIGASHNAKYRLFGVGRVRRADQSGEITPYNFRSRYRQLGAVQI